MRVPSPAASTTVRLDRAVICISLKLESMIRKKVQRLSEKITLNQKTKARWDFT
jgi:hypothetical protein